MYPVSVHSCKVVRRVYLSSPVLCRNHLFLYSWIDFDFDRFFDAVRLQMFFRRSCDFGTCDARLLLGSSWALARVLALFSHMLV